MLRTFLPLVLAVLIGCNGGGKETPETRTDDDSKMVSTDSGITRTPAEPQSRGLRENTPPEGVLPSFVDVAEDWNVDFTRYDDQRGEHRIMEVNGGGVGMLDYDLDGRIDLFFPDGCVLPVRDDDGEHPSALLRHAVDPDTEAHRFEDVTADTGLGPLGFACGCAVGDFDEDGFPDLFVTAYGENTLWNNNGDGTFTRVPIPGANDEWSTSAAFADLDRDGRLDLYVVNYVDADDDPPRLCPNPAHPDGFLHCPPTVFDAVEDVLLVNDGEGGFVDRTEAAGITATDGKGLGVAVLDVDHDGVLDVYVANDGVPNHLYHGRNPSPEDAMPRFVEEALGMGLAVNRQGVAEASMGIACGDIDRDGWPDIFLSHFFAESNTLYHNLDGEVFDDVSGTSRLAVTSLRYLGFGTEFVDWDNDGWEDLVVANGHVDDFESIDPSEPYAMRSQAFRNERNERFLEVTEWAGAPFENRYVARGLAKGDLDEDGRLDVVISRQRSKAGVLRNETETENASASFRLIGTGRAPRTPIGTRLIAEFEDGTTYHELVGGGSFQSASEQRVHIGFGDDQHIRRLRILWPNDEGTDEFENVPPGRFVIVRGRSLLREPQSR